MQFSVNYSEPLVKLLQTGKAQVDLIKLPAWPNLVETALKVAPCYIHFPLNVGDGLGDAMNSETNQRVDWDFIEALMQRTDTPIINVHLSPHLENNPQVIDDPWNEDTFACMAEQTLRDLEGVIRRWGKEIVIAENPFPDAVNVSVSSTPRFVRSVIETVDIGFLLDVSHARLSARKLGLDEKEYLRQLPLERTREIHITGIKTMEGEYLEKLLQNPPKEFDITDFIGEEIDHQSMSEDDFSFLEHVYQLIDNGICREPWVASMEHGGLGSFWELSIDEHVLAQQVPRLYNMTHSVKVKEVR
ncbi:MAG: DUF692 family multinuclear iron-containing protein [Anaerolineae bacterium]|jgi:uncharacterized protein (UPF0276 family)|nr:DUF692 family multinuclear iron-containing protein [Anaerolineae bacterium]